MLLRLITRSGTCHRPLPTWEQVLPQLLGSHFDKLLLLGLRYALDPMCQCISHLCRQGIYWHGCVIYFAHRCDLQVAESKAQNTPLDTLCLQRTSHFWQMLCLVPSCSLAFRMKLEGLPMDCTHHSSSWMRKSCHLEQPCMPALLLMLFRSKLCHLKAKHTVNFDCTHSLTIVCRRALSHTSLLTTGVTVGHKKSSRLDKTGNHSVLSSVF